MRERNLAHTPTADRRRFTLEFGRPVKIGRPKSVCVQLALMVCNVYDTQKIPKPGTVRVVSGYINNGNGLTHVDSDQLIQLIA
ncbi:hypothetical protein J6590_038179 [Homalodisca vitripennis]|nr:hypothetical protein J6590_038179 [Homalodisca vitripennis]